MSCSNFERLIALDVEGDLSSTERGRVEAHLRECSDCWDLAEELRESQSVFKSLREDVPDAAALLALRERVLSEVGGLESMTWFERFLFGGLRRKAALAGVALVLVGSGALWMARSTHVPPEAPPEVVERTPAVVVPPPAAKPETPPPAPALSPRRVPRSAPRVQETRQVAIQFVTEDPNIIIYWLVDQKGE
jgi:hypothetical protein